MKLTNWPVDQLEQVLQRLHKHGQKKKEKKDDWMKFTNQLLNQFEQSSMSMDKKEEKKIIR